MSTAMEKHLLQGLIHSLILSACSVPYLGSVLGQSNRQLWSSPPRPHRPEGEQRWELPVTKQHGCAGQGETWGAAGAQKSRVPTQIGN